MTVCNDTPESINANNLTPIVSTNNSFTSLPTTVCNDTPESKNASSLISTDNFAYSPTIQIYQLDKITAEFEKNAIIRFEDPFIEIYGQTVFNESLISFNNFLSAANANEFLNISVNYPLVKTRIDKGVAITPIEFTEFMEDSGYNPNTIVTQQSLNPRRILSLYNSHLNGRFSESTMGTFCQLAPVVFGAVAGFFTTIGAIANKITDIINGLQNFSLASLLDNLKKKIMTVIENSINKLKNVIQNFSLEGIVNSAQQFFHTQILCRFKELKDQALSFFDKENIENFKKRIEGLISYATSLFKNISLEEIQFLIYRFCSFITQVEDIINTVRKPLDNFSNRYVTAGKILETRSNYNTASAIAAGAKRFNNTEISGAVSTGLSNEVAAGNAPPPSSGEVDGVTPWNDGNGDSRVEFGSGPRSDGPESWYRVDVIAKVGLMRVQQKFGRKLIVTSAYRSTEKQARLFAEAVQKYGSEAAARKKVAPPGSSKHEGGTALDVTWSGYPSGKSEFIQYAREAGFKGFGVNYDSFVHIDLGPERQW